MRTLVTGAAGFIGSTLVDRLLEEGHQVTGVDNLSAGSPAANLESAHRHSGTGRFTFVGADVRHPALSDVVAGANPDVVFHLAAQIDVRRSIDDPQHDARNNVLGTINLLEASRRARVPRIVYAASGGSRYGATTTLPATEDTAVDPLSPYAVAKCRRRVLYARLRRHVRASAHLSGTGQRLWATPRPVRESRRGHGFRQCDDLRHVPRPSTAMAAPPATTSTSTTP